jgi:hypothetical protein
MDPAVDLVGSSVELPQEQESMTDVVVDPELELGMSDDATPTPEVGEVYLGMELDAEPLPESEGEPSDPVSSELSSPQTSVEALGDEAAPPSAPSIDIDIEADFIEQQLDAVAVSEAESLAGIAGTEIDTTDIPETEGELSDEIEAVFSDDWLDGVEQNPPSEESGPVEPDELIQTEDSVPLDGIPFESEPSQIETDLSPFTEDVESKADPVAWLEDYAEPESELSTSPSDTPVFPEDLDQRLDQPEAIEPPAGSRFPEETDRIPDGPSQDEAIVIGGIEVTEDFEDYAGTVPFEEAAGIAESVQVDGITTESEDLPGSGDEVAIDSIEAESETESTVVEKQAAQIVDHVDPPAGTRYRVVLKRAKANIPFGICAHCMRSPATNELIILDPWMAPEAEKKPLGYTLFLCPSCYQRARAQSDQARNARITALLISALVALTVIVFAVIIGLVNFRENPLVDAAILTILGIIGFLIPAMILMNRANQYPPSADASYVRSTLFIPPRGDETEVIFEWRNKQFAERFAESNYELVLGEVSEIPDQAPGLHHNE